MVEERPKKRAYSGRVQAEVAALTRQRIIEASLIIFDERAEQNTTLQQIAKKAGVTVQTILRHFGSREQLAREVGQEAFRLAMRPRSEVAIGDMAQAMHALVESYEMSGTRILRGLVIEAQDAQMHEIIEIARNYHRDWLRRIFAPFLVDREEQEQAEILVELYVTTDTYTWHLLRSDCHLSREQTEKTMQKMVEALLARG